MIRPLFALFVLTFALPVLAQTVAAPQPKPAVVRVALTTDAGPVTLEVETERAPITAGNFLRYVDEKRLDGASFYRSVGEADFGFIQGGVRNDPARLLPPIAHEPTSRTGLTHDDDALSMARFAPGSATADFFIVMGRMPTMDANPAATGDNQGFAVFGHVVDGMDVVKKILAASRSPDDGEGVMKGQMLATPVKILTARRAP